MKTYSFIAGFLQLMIISGCTSTIESQPSTVTPSMYSDDYIRGIIHKDKYVAMDYSFSIDLPFKKGSQEYNQMYITESYHRNHANIVFTDTGKNNSVYYLEIMKKNNGQKVNSPFSTSAVALLNQYRKEYSRTKVTDIIVTNENCFQIKGYNGIAWEMTQDIYPKNYLFNARLAKHKVYVINLKDHIVLISAKGIASDNDQNTKISAFKFASSLSLLQNVPRLEILEAFP